MPLGLGVPPSIRTTPTQLLKLLLVSHHHHYHHQPLTTTKTGTNLSYTAVSLYPYRFLPCARYLRDPRVLVAECFAFVWGANTPMVVVDIDGTITRSDVSGLLMTLRPGLITDRTHAGICKTLARMVDKEVRG